MPRRGGAGPRKRKRPDAHELSKRTAALERRVKQLEAEQRATADLLDFAAHELMTPVTSLEAFSHILSRDTAAGQDSAGKRCLEGIGRNTARLVALVDELLDIGRLRVGRVVPARALFDLRELARAGAVSAAASDAGRTLDVEAPDAPVMVDGDRDQLGRLTVELVRDCAARAPDGSAVTLSITPGRRRARATARDRAPAIAVEILERGFHGRRRTADYAPAGTRGGLGLALGAEVLVRLGGTFGAESGPGGNALWFELPLAR